MAWAFEPGPIVEAYTSSNSHLGRLESVHVQPLMYDRPIETRNVGVLCHLTRLDIDHGDLIDRRLYNVASSFCLCIGFFHREFPCSVYENPLLLSLLFFGRIQLRGTYQSILLQS